MHADTPTADPAGAYGQRVRLGRIAPLLLLICFLLDISLRVLPSTFFAFRAWEAMTLFATEPAPFIPNATYTNNRSSGDLASLANLPQQRQFREEVFTTDAAGRRNRAEAAKPFTGILIIGDSFAAGSGVSDPLTLSEQLASLSGRRVYSGGDTPGFWELLQRLQMNRGLVIWQQSERRPLLVSTVPELSRNRKRLIRVIGSERAEALHRSYKYFEALKAYSPLEILFRRVVKVLQNDKILPNPYQREAVVGKLRNGREILFLPSEVENYDLDRPTDASGFVQLKRQLQERGIQLLVLLVPDKYAVYHDLLSIPPGKEHRQFQDVVEERLLAAHVPVLNLTPRFRKQADALFARDEYLYWLDDTHWNAEGIREAAESIADSKAVSECVCR